MFNGTDFVYVKSLPEERMKRENPMDGGVFSESALAAIVSNNATLVDYVIAAEDAKGKKYFAVNTTAASAAFPLPVSKRRTLTAPSVSATSVKYGSFGDAAGDIVPIIQRDFADAVIPPYSVNMLR